LVAQQKKSGDASEVKIGDIADYLHSELQKGWISNA
jgi:hypothetical protein